MAEKLFAPPAEKTEACETAKPVAADEMFPTTTAKMPLRNVGREKNQRAAIFATPRTSRSGTIKAEDSLQHIRISLLSLSSHATRRV